MGSKAPSFGLAFVFFLFSCNGHPDNNTNKDTIAPNSTDSTASKATNDARTLDIDKALVKKYEGAFQDDTTSSKRTFFSKLLNIIKQFDGRKLDTTLLTIGNLDGDNDRDTIFSRVYYKSDSIYVDSKWIKNNNVIWNYEYTDPYLELNSDLLEYRRRSTWAIFAVGIVYGPPDFHSRKELDDRIDSNLQNQVVENGVADLKEMGIPVSKESYKIYLQSFKGDLLAIGEPEMRERLWIWYKPAGRLITFYQP